MCRARFLEDLLKDGSDWIRPAPAGVWVHGTESLGYINVGRMILYRYWNCVPVLTNVGRMILYRYWNCVPVLTDVGRMILYRYWNCVPVLTDVGRMILYRYWNCVPVLTNVGRMILYRYWNCVPVLTNVGRMILYRYWNCVPVLTNATIGRADKGNLACNTCFRLVSQMCWLLFKCSMQNLLFVWFWTRKEDETFLFKRRRAYELLLHNVFSGRSAPTPQCSARRIWWELLQLIVVCIVDAVCH